VQNQFSPAFRSSEDELAHCAELTLTPAELAQLDQS